EMVLVAKGSQIAEDPEPLRLFIAALGRGTRDAVDHPNQAIDSVLQANDALDPKVTRAQVNATLPLLEQGGDTAPGGRPFGYQDTAKWQAFINWMVEQKVLDQPARAVDVLTNELLPSSQIDPE